MPEGVTDEDLARMKLGFELYNQGDYDSLREFVSPDVVMERVGEQPPIEGWEAFRAFQEPDAFEWQRLEPLDWRVNGDKVLIRLRVRSKGAVSGVELELEGWMVWTVSDHEVVRIVNAQDEERALEAFRAPA